MYGTVEDWIAYAAARGTTVVDDAASAAALVRASDYIEYRYVANLLPGYDETLPVVEKATYEAASLELATPGFFSRTYTPAEQRVLVQVEGIRWQPVGDAKGPQNAAPVSTKIEAMFEPYVYPNRAPFFSMKTVGT